MHLSTDNSAASAAATTSSPRNVLASGQCDIVLIRGALIIGRSASLPITLPITGIGHLLNFISFP